MKMNILCYISVILLLSVDGMISMKTLKVAYNMKSKEGYIISFGTLTIVLSIAALLFMIP